MMLCNMCGSNVEENVSFESAENGFRCWQKFRVMLPKCMGGDVEEDVNFERRKTGRESSDGTDKGRASVVIKNV